MADHSGHRQRLKTEFLTNGLKGMPDARVLELLLCYAIPQGDVNDLAHELLERFGSLSGVLDALPAELKKVKGVGDHTAVLLKLIPALNGRYLADRMDLSNCVHSAEEAGAILSAHFYGARNEMVCLLALDGKNKFLGVRKVAEGSIHAADINIRRIAEEALSLRAAKIYLAHNHISNLPFPSAADWQTTDTLRVALAALDLELVDHLIFVDGDMVSLNQSEGSGHRPVYQLL